MRLQFPSFHLPRASLGPAVVVIAIASTYIQPAECQPPSGPPPAFALGPVAPANDAKRFISEISDSSGTIITKLSSNVGFAQGFTVSLAPYKLLLIPTPGDGSVHHGFRVKFDMDNDGSSDTDTFIIGPGGEGYNQSAKGTGSHNFPEPAFPNTNSRFITWSVIEERRLVNGGAIVTGTIISGAMAVTILPTPSATYTEVSAPTAEASTLTGYISLNGWLNWPLVICEGFDPSNTTYASEFLGFMFAPNGANPSLMSTLAAAGYDVFVYNPGDGGLSPRDNAIKLLGALTKIKSEVGSWACPPDAKWPTRLMGVSAGGVIGRYALAWAEAHGYDHGCDMFISADAPQAYAELNSGFQLFLEGNMSNPVIAEYSNALMSTAAKELLRVNQFDAPPGTFLNPTPMSGAFFTELNGLNGNGYPHSTRNIGLAFGEGDIANKSVSSIAPGAVNWVGQSAIATVDVSVPGFADITWNPAYFEPRDIMGGSLQPTFREKTITDHRLFWKGNVAMFQVHEPVALHTTMTLGANGAPAFIHVASALDLQGVHTIGDVNETIDCWTGTKFDAMYIDAVDPVTVNWHDRFPPAIATTVVQELLGHREVVAPAAGSFHANGEALAIDWKWRSASSVDIAISVNGGTTFTNLIAGLSPVRKVPFLDPDGDLCYKSVDPNSNGTYVANTSFPASNQAVIRVTSHYPGGDSVERRSGAFNIWGVDQASIACLTSFSCDAPTMSLQLSWNTNYTPVGAGVDVVEVYRPGEIPGVDAPQTAIQNNPYGFGGYASHAVLWQGACQEGTWLIRVKSTQTGFGTVVSDFKVQSVTGCASCPGGCHPPCELE